MDDELKHILRSRWLSSLFEFAVPEFQKRLWINAEYPNIIGDYTEAICKYFNDLNLEEGYQDFIQQGVISQVEFNIISDFHQQLERYIDRPEKQTLSDKHILMDPEWKTLSEIAKNNWDKLKTVIANEGERKFMDELELKYLSS